MSQIDSITDSAAPPLDAPPLGSNGEITGVLFIWVTAGGALVPVPISWECIMAASQEHVSDATPMAPAGG